MSLLFNLKISLFVFFNTKNTSSIIDFINSAQEDLNIEDVNQLIDILAQRKEELKTVNIIL